MTIRRFFSQFEVSRLDTIFFPLENRVELAQLNREKAVKHQICPFDTSQTPGKRDIRTRIALSHSTGQSRLNSKKNEKQE